MDAQADLDTSRLLEIASVLVRLNHIAGFVVKAHHAVPIRLAKLPRFLQNSVHMKTTTLQLRDLMNRSPLHSCLLIPLVLAYFALSPQARAVCQRGCLTNQNTVLGDDALFSLTTGIENTATGFQALFSNTIGSDNTANGVSALYSNIDGGANTANGARALYNNTSGARNTATGTDALNTNTTGNNNTANGVQALFLNATGFDNTAIGFIALGFNTTGNSNTAIGAGALQFNTSGSNNIAFGLQAGINLTTGDNNIEIGNAGVAGESRTIRIGTTGTQTKTFIAGVSGVTVPGGVGVIVGNNGKLGTVVSSARFKEAIKPMDKASEAILALKPVTFHYKQQLDPEGIAQFGLVAEEVEKVSPDLVARDEQGRPYTVRYEAVNAMLLNEFLKEHGKVEKLEATVAQQQKQIEALTAGLRKVSAQVEVSRPAPQTVVDNQ
jgi:hypothetical protein